MTTKTLCLLGVLFLAIGSTFAQSAKKPYIVFVSGDHEYSSEETFPIIAKELETKYGFRTTVLKSSPDENAEENIPISYTGEPVTSGFNTRYLLDLVSLEVSDVLSFEIKNTLAQWQVTVPFEDGRFIAIYMPMRL